MKKVKCLSLILSVLLLMQSVLVPAAAETETTQTEQAETEQAIKDATKATIRCIPIDSFVCEEEGKCVYSGKPSKRRVIFAKSY